MYIWVISGCIIMMLQLLFHNLSSQFWGLNSPDFEGSPATFSMLPTNPRDWITVDALPAQLHHWSDSALYIIGNRQALRDVPDDLFPNCTFVPVDVRLTSLIRVKFNPLLLIVTD